jgi:serine/alanine adding enzyme
MASGKTKILAGTEESINEWSRYYNMISRKGIYHCPQYIKVLQKHSGNPAELFIFEINDNNFIYYPYFKRSLEKLPLAQHCESFPYGYFDIDSSWYYGGPLIQSNHPTMNHELVTSFTIAFSDYCKASKIVSEFIRFDPNLLNYKYFENLLPLSKNRDTVYVDLAQPEDDIWIKMEGRARTAIRKAEKMGVKVHASNNKENLLKFCEIYALEMERKAALPHYRFSRQFISRLFDTICERIQLIYAEIDGIFISGGIFIYELGQAAHYFLMATHHAYRHYQANNLILYEAMRFFKSKGIKIFDLQGGRESVFNFKKSFSKNRAPFFTSGIVRNEIVYDKLVKLKENDLGSKELTFFPVYRVKETN